jgi:SSS family solute:Na+ symporter
MLCRQLFGVDSLAEGTIWAMVDPLVIALPASAAATLLFSFIGAKVAEEHVAHCFRNIR